MKTHLCFSLWVPTQFYFWISVTAQQSNPFFTTEGREKKKRSRDCNFLLLLQALEDKPGGGIILCIKNAFVKRKAALLLPFLCDSEFATSSDMTNLGNEVFQDSEVMFFSLWFSGSLLLLKSLNWASYGWRTSPWFVQPFQKEPDQLRMRGKNNGPAHERKLESLWHGKGKEVGSCHSRSLNSQEASEDSLRQIEMLVDYLRFCHGSKIEVFSV